MIFITNATVATFPQVFDCSTNSGTLCNAHPLTLPQKNVSAATPHTTSPVVIDSSCAIFGTPESLVGI